MSAPPDRIRKLVVMANTSGAEGAVARGKARAAIAELDTELLSTLEGQRKQLLAELRAESRRLGDPRERATKVDTGELITSAMLLLGHYQRHDALMSAVMLLRVESGRRLTNEELQQLDGPVENALDRWARAGRERRQAERSERRAQKRKGRVT